VTGVIQRNHPVSKSQMLAKRPPILRVFWISLMVLAFSAVPAQATLMVLPDGSPAPQLYQGWVDAAYVPTPPGEVIVSLDGCPGDVPLPSCAPENQHLIQLDPQYADRHVVLHELGHVFDDLMPDWVRPRFRAMVAPRKRGQWSAANGRAPLNEQFAEAYSLCAMKLSLRTRHYGNYGYNPSPRLHAKVCALINAAGAGFGE
jgi:hypothetical protein